MKLIFAIVHYDDSHKVMQELNKNGFTVTKLSSSGGFLKSGNTTLMIGVENEKVDKVIEVIQNTSQSRKEMISAGSMSTEMSGAYAPYPVEITVGGATIFVTDVERFEKL